MRVDAAESKATDRGAAEALFRRPAFRALQNAEMRAFLVPAAGKFFKIRSRWQRAFLHGHQDFGQPGCACGCEHVTYIGFHRTEYALGFKRSLRPKLEEGFPFRLITERCARGM